MTDYGPLDAAVAAIRPANPKIAACFDQVEAILKTVAPPDVTPPPVFPGWDTLPPFTPTQTIVLTSGAQLASALHAPVSGALYDARALPALNARLTADGRPDKLTRFLTGPLAGPSSKQADKPLGAALVLSAALNLQVVATGPVSAPWGTGVIFQGYKGTLCTGCSFWGQAGVANTGLGSFAVNGDGVTDYEIRLDGTRWGTKTWPDIHGGDKTGIHCGYIGQSGGVMAVNGKIVLRAHDSDQGNGLQYTNVDGLEVWLETVNLTGEPTANGTAGNSTDPFSDPSPSKNVVYHYLVADKGRKALNLSGGGIGATGSLRVDYGRATNMRDPDPYDRAMHAPGVTLVDCKP